MSTKTTFRPRYSLVYLSTICFLKSHLFLQMGLPDNLAPSMEAVTLQCHVD